MQAGLSLRPKAYGMSGDHKRHESKDAWSSHYMVYYLRDYLGFQGIEQAAIDALYYYSITFIQNMALDLHEWCQLSGRSTPHAMDIYHLLKLYNMQPDELLTFCYEQHSLHKCYLNSDLHYMSVNFPHNTSSHKANTTEPPTILRILSPPSNIIHAFTQFGSETNAGLPPLPPAHTFKSTVIPIRRNPQESKIVLQMAIERRRLEQNLKTLLKFSGRGPKTVSYDDLALWT
jgi:hypothetical protein